MLLIGVSVVFLLLGSSSIGALADASLTMRILGVGVVALVFFAKRSPQQRRDNRLRLSRGSVWVFIVGNVIFLAAATLPHEQTATFLVRLLTLALFLVFASVLAARFTALEVTNGVLLATFSIIVASFIFAALNRSVGIENLRLRGIMENANVLGFISTVFIVVLIASRKKMIVYLGGLAIGLTSLALSGSRASLFMLVVALIGFAIIKVPRVRVLLFIAAVGLIYTFTQNQSAVTGFTIFRTTDSRNYGREIANLFARENLLFGYGFQNGLDGIASSPLAVVVQAGFVGLLGLVLLYVSLLVASRKVGPLAMIFATAAIAHSFFENWPLSLSGPMMFLFIVAWLALAKTDVKASAVPSERYDSALSTR